MSARNGTAPRDANVMLVVGEASGDELGGQLMAAPFRGSAKGGRVTGVGGPAMIAEGLQPLFSIETTAVMGVREVVPRIPGRFCAASVQRLAEFALDTRPDVLVIIESPDFTHRIARRVKRSNPAIPIVNYAPPQVWASRSYRARMMARYIDAVIVFFPFEAQFFERYGIDACISGYPVVERADRIRAAENAFRIAHGIAPDAPLIASSPRLAVATKSALFCRHLPRRG